MSRFGLNTRKRFRKALLYLISALVLTETLFPVVWTVFTAIRPEKELYKRILVPRRLTLEHFLCIFRPGTFHQVESRGFGRYMLNSFIVASSVAFIGVLLSTFAAYSIARMKYRGKNVISVILLFAYLFPGVVLMAPIYLMFSTLNLLNTYHGLIIVHLAVNIPFATWILSGYFQGIPPELEEAAMVDGCSRLGAIFRMILPVSIPGIITAAIYIFTRSWDDLIFPMILFTEEDLYTLPLVSLNLIYGEYIKWGQLMAAAVTSAAVPAILYMYVQKYLVRGLTAGAVKG